MVLQPKQFDPKPYFTKGGQGKLFADPKPTDEHRYQRGYTPERMAEVRGASKAMPIYNDRSETGRDAGRPAQTPEAHKLHEIIARSTTPMSEITNPPNRSMTREFQGKQIEDKDEPGLRNLDIHYNTDFGNRRFAGLHTGAQWYANGGNLSKPRTLGATKIQLGEGYSDAHTLLHEMGHYRSQRVEGNSPPRTPTQRGKEEARADDNAAERFRPDPRDVRAGNKEAKVGSAPYEYESAFRGYGGKTAHKAYLKARKTPLASQANVKESARRQVQAYKQQTISNDMLFHRTHQEEEGAPQEWKPNKQHIDFTSPPRQSLFSDRRGQQPHDEVLARHRAASGND